MKTKYSHIAEKDRGRIEALTQAGNSNKEIATHWRIEKHDRTRIEAEWRIWRATLRLRTSQEVD